MKYFANAKCEIKFASQHLRSKYFIRVSVFHSEAISLAERRISLKKRLVETSRFFWWERVDTVRSRFMPTAPSRLRQNLRAADFTVRKAYRGFSAASTNHLRCSSPQPYITKTKNRPVGRFLVLAVPNRLDAKFKGLNLATFFYKLNECFISQCCF